MKRFILTLVFFLSACSVQGITSTQWMSVNDSLPNHLTVLSLLVDPQDTSGLFAATYDSIGMYRSRDGGETWQRDNSGLPAGPVFVLAAMQDAIWAGTSDGLYVRKGTNTNWRRADQIPHTAVYALHQGKSKLYAGTAGSGVYSSGDGGETWQRFRGLENETVLSILESGDALNVGTSGHGMLTTRDNGQTWFGGSELSSAIVSFIQQDPRDSQIVYARTRNGLYRSTDGGHLFDRLGAEITAKVIHAMLVDPARNRIYVATAADGVLLSDNEGESWQAARTPLPEERGVLALAQVAGTLYAGTVDGVFKSDDAGENWQRIGQGLGVPDLHALVLSTDGNKLYAITEDGLYSRGQGSTSWERIGGQELDTPVLSLATVSGDAQHLLAGTSHRGVFLSDDGGTTWRAARGDLGGKTSVVGLLLDPHDSQTVYARVLYERIYRSQDGGEHWDAMWTGMSRDTEVETMALDLHAEGLVYAGTNEGLYYSTDGGESWTPRGLAGVSVLSLWIDPTQSGRVLAGATDGLYLTTDGGEHWGRIALDNITVTAIAADGRGYMLAGTAYQGAFINRDGSALRTWDRLGEGLADASVDTLVVDEAHGAVYASTERGVFRLEQ